MLAGVMLVCTAGAVTWLGATLLGAMLCITYVTMVHAVIFGAIKYHDEEFVKVVNRLVIKLCLDASYVSATCVR